MSARLKSSVLRREERGIGSISMARLIVSGMVGGLVFMGLSLLRIRLLMIPGGLAAFIAGLIFTGTRHGLPLYRHLFIMARAHLLLAAEAEEDSLAARIVAFFEMDAAALTLDTVSLLSAPTIFEEDGTLDEWEIVLDSAYSAGFEVVTDTLLLEGELT